MNNLKSGLFPIILVHICVKESQCQTAHWQSLLCVCVSYNVNKEFLLVLHICGLSVCVLGQCLDCHNSCLICGCVYPIQIKHRFYSSDNETKKKPSQFPPLIMPMTRPSMLLNLVKGISP